jgi:hypothetical protein
MSELLGPNPEDYYTSSARVLARLAIDQVVINGRPKAAFQALEVAARPFATERIYPPEFGSCLERDRRFVGKMRMRSAGGEGFYVFEYQSKVSPDSPVRASATAVVLGRALCSPEEVQACMDRMEQYAQEVVRQTGEDPIQYGDVDRLLKGSFGVLPPGELSALYHFLERHTQVSLKTRRHVLLEESVALVDNSTGDVALESLHTIMGAVVADNGGHVPKRAVMRTALEERGIRLRTPEELTALDEALETLRRGRPRQDNRTPRREKTLDEKLASQVGTPPVRKWR